MIRPNLEEDIRTDLDSLLNSNGLLWSFNVLDMNTIALSILTTFMIILFCSPVAAVPAVAPFPNQLCQFKPFYINTNVICSKGDSIISVLSAN